MTVWEAIAVFVGIPLALYVVLGLFTLREKFAGKTRYRPGAGWDYDAQWWIAEANGVSRPAQPQLAQPLGPTARGGARDSW